MSKQSFEYQFKADTDDFAAGARKVAAEVNMVTAAGTNMTNKLGSYFKGLSGQMLGLFGSAAIANAMRDVANEAGKIRDGAAGLDLTIKQYQELDYVARQTGAGLQDFVQAIKAVANAQAAALRGNQETTDTFARMGINLQQLRSLNPHQLMDAIGTSMKGTSGPALNLADAVKILGGTAEKVLPAMVEGFKEMKDDAEKLGVILGDEVVMRLAQMSDQMTTLQLQSRGLIAELTLLFAKFGRGVGDVFDLPGKAIGAAVGSLNVDLKDSISTDEKQTASNLSLAARNAFNAAKGALTAEMDQRAKIEAMVQARAAAAREGRTPGSSAMAVFEQKALEELRQKVSEAERDAMPRAERLNALMRERAEIQARISTEADESAKLQLRLQELKLNKEIEAGREVNKGPADGIEREVSQMGQARINVDTLTRIGGHRGGERTDARILAAQQQSLKNIERHSAESARALKEIAN